MEHEAKRCVRCGKVVEENAEQYELFERMHWLCFHLEYEHEGDPDRPCQDPACPWWIMDVYRKRLEELDEDPEEVVNTAVRSRWSFED